MSGLLISTSPAQAASSSVVISEVYGGGGNAGSTWTNDFVELYNGSDATVDISGWAVQYYSASGTTTSGTATLTGSVAAHHTYLVQLAKGTSGSTPLPTPDSTGSAAMSGTNGRVDLVQADTTIVDRVGYGAATVAEGTAAPTLTDTTSATRNTPCADTDNNATDFRATDPTPEKQRGRQAWVCRPAPCRRARNNRADPGDEPHLAIQGQAGCRRPRSGDSVEWQRLLDPDVDPGR